MVADRPRKIIISGYYGESNLGDEAILAVLLDWLRRHLESAEITVVSLNPELTRQEHKVNAIGYDNLYEIDELVRNADLVINGGGGVFHEYNAIDIPKLFDDPSSGIISYAVTPILAAIYDVPCMLFAHGVGPILTVPGAQLVRHVFKLAASATVRDEESLALLEELGVVNHGDPQIPVSSDPTFLLQPASEERIKEIWDELGLTELPKPFIGISMRAWFERLNNGFIPEFARCLDQLAEQTGGSLVFLPFQTKEGFSDVEVINQVRHEMRSATHIAMPATALSPGEMLGMISRFDMILGMRFHAILFAIASGVPCLGFSFDPKVRNMLRRIGQGNNYLDLNEGFDADALLKLTANLLAQANSVRTQLQVSLPKLKAAAQLNFDKLENLLNLEPKSLPARLSAPAPSKSIRLTQARQLKSSLQWSAELQQLLEATTRQLEATTRQFETTCRQLETTDRQLYTARQELAATQQVLLESERHVAALRQQLHSTTEQLWATEHQLVVANERAQALYNESLSLRHLAKNLLRAVARKVFPRKIRKFIKLLYLWPEAYVLEPNAELEVKVYTEHNDQFANYPNRVLLSQIEQPRTRRPITLIATIKNEGQGILKWLDSIKQQTRRPDEVIIVDGGSTDNTVELIITYEQENRLGIRVISEPGVNVARGRNIAIAAAAHDQIVATDAGCELDPRWLELISLPFDLHPETEVIAGFYTVKGSTRFGKVSAKLQEPDLQAINPSSFSPSSRSIAFRKSFMLGIGGYPEYLTLSGEDTLMNIRARANARHWAFVPDAIVTWQPAHSFTKLFRTCFSWGRGDAEARIFPQHYEKLATVYGSAFLLLLLAAILAGVYWPVAVLPLIGACVIWFKALRDWGVQKRMFSHPVDFIFAAGIVSTMHLGKLYGFLKGRSNRPMVDQRRFADIKRNILMLAGIPINDTGGGQRSTQLTLEFLQQGCRVTYVNRFPSYETKKINLRYLHPQLDCESFDRFDPVLYSLLHEAILSKTTVLVEYPVSEYITIAEQLRAKGAQIVYDKMDKWDSALGGDWYSRSAEDQLIEFSDILVATALDIKEEMESRAAGKPVHLIPNAVNGHLFDVAKNYERPLDLPEQRPLIGYTGSMYGEWFREDLVIKTAESNPEAAVVLLGDARERFSKRPPNLFTLGLKPHVELPAYLAHFDVCIIPFEASELIQATSPLKVFEYLAMGKPVVATFMRELEGLPYVLVSKSDEEFMQNIGKALDCHPDPEVTAEFAKQQSWEKRIEILLKLMEAKR